ncbi:flagellar hook assembly protein [Roseibium aquae]|uniref:Basal-body rod modification protein FlgD n=1 Tax=Roseibium aquae TaxID=1323746 RepID=A0A916T973_9HYPH|nr:flagellar hook capping FlgD N-terminal domain-containing protein [Roseibium aquae]GGB34626.1 flagellar hook assembly protein [Roseibium aquae]
MITLPSPTQNGGGVQSSPTGSAEQSLLGNYDLFLTLLTTQIQNQDPLEPLDSAEYTNQLVQYSSVEQSIQTNDYLKELLASMQSAQASSYVSYLGTEVSAKGGTTSLRGGTASWDFTLGQEAAGKVEIVNGSGNVVFSDDISMPAGSNSYVWDGKNDAGGVESDGSYTIRFDLKNASGNTITPSVEISGVVDGVDLSSGTPFLQIGGSRVPVSNVTSVRAI